jgi:hypothetical protein
MNRTPSKLGPALFVALATVLSSALTVRFPHAPGTFLAVPLLFVLALRVGVASRRRERGTRSARSTGAWILAASVVAACGIVLGSGLDHLAEMIPILAGCAAIPLTQRDADVTACARRARAAVEPTT